MKGIFDLHCDTPYFIQKKKINHIKTDRLRTHGYIGAVYAHFIMPRMRYPFVEVIKMLTSTIAFVEKIPDVRIIRSRKEVKESRLNIILGVEGGHVFDNTFKQVEALYELGVRVFTITWNNSNQLAHSALEADSRGVTKRGREYLQKLHAYDVILDLSHASTRTVLDVCEHADNQVMASHSCVRALNPKFKRNIDDKAIDAIKKKKGVIGVNISRYHLGDHSFADHIDYLVQRCGIDIAAIGTDFDGINDPVIKSPADIGVLENDLKKRGYTKDDIQKIYSANSLRILKSGMGSALHFQH
ncbi:membrane dipeptidase [candidate division WOR-3 bacterium]|nr:membrane dipeptidase [candidate division WOR-3 bacterium]